MTPQCEIAKSDVDHLGYPSIIVSPDISPILEVAFRYYEGDFGKALTWTHALASGAGALFHMCGDRRCVKPSHVINYAVPETDEGKAVLMESIERRCGTFNGMIHYQQNQKPMADIESLKVSISEMEDDEILQRILEIRNNRRSGGATAKPSKTKRKAQNVDLTSMIKNMSPEDRAALIAELSKNS